MWKGFANAKLSGLKGHDITYIDSISRDNINDFDLIIDEREPIKLTIKARPNFEDYTPTKAQIQQLPQKVKHKRKINFHN